MDEKQQAPAGDGATEQQSDDQQPAGEPKKKGRPKKAPEASLSGVRYIAKSRIKHGRPSTDGGRGTKFVFEPGDELKGLTPDEIAYLVQTGVAEEVVG